MPPEEAPPESARSAADAMEASLMEKAATFEERSMAFRFASAVRQQQMIRQAAALIAAESWGKGISPVARAAVARYALEIGADPVRHIDVLGGSVYLNGDFYMELVASNPRFLRDEMDFVHDDSRASEAERARRREARVKYGIPETAKGAAVITLHYSGGRGPFIGFNWAGTGKTHLDRNNRTVLNDPVGEEEPVKTALTRAYRKAALKSEPAWFLRHPGLKAAEEIIVQGRELDAKVPEGVDPDTGEVRQPVADPGAGVEIHPIALAAPSPAPEVVPAVAKEPVPVAEDEAPGGALDQRLAAEQDEGRLL